MKVTLFRDTQVALTAETAAERALLTVLGESGPIEVKLARFNRAAGGGIEGNITLGTVSPLISAPYTTRADEPGQ